MMKKIRLIGLSLFLSVSCFALNIRIIESTSANPGHVMDGIWSSVVTSMGHTPTISPQTTMDNTAFFASTDILIISSGVINISALRISNVLAFLQTGKPVYIQSEYQSSYQANQAFASIVGSLGGTFTWGPTMAGTLAPMQVLGSFATTNNSVPSISYYWYSCVGTGDCNTFPFLFYNNANHGWQYVPSNPAWGNIITTTDQDWVNQSTSLPLMQNIITHLINPTFIPSSSGGVNLGNDTTLCTGNQLVLNATSPSSTYLWQNNSTAATFTVTAPGIYYVTVSGVCGTSQDTITVSFSSLSVSLQSQTNISCNGGTNGSATVTASGGGPYTYSWAPSGGNAATANNLGPGIYTVTVTNPACSTTQTVSITQPSAITIAPLSNQATCGNNNGNASVVVSGGTGTYTYAWAPSGGTAATESNLGPGTYTCTVTDGNNCQSTQTFTITQTPAITIVPSSTAATCGNTNGSATVVASGGSGTYTYAWAPSGGTAATENNLGAGTYTCTVTDVNNCQSTQTFTITTTNSINVTVQSQNDVSCNGGSNGDATVNPTGGNGPYSFSWAPSGGNNATATNLSAGIYTVTVTDASLCTSTQTVSITEPTSITLTTSSTAATCGNNNGTADVVASGGTGVFTYSWAPSGGTAATEINLASGTYTVTVNDANSCTSTATVSVGSNSSVTATILPLQNVSCNAGTDGSATLNPSGGTGPYTFAWSPGGGTNATENNLAAGNYTVIITDAVLCSSTVTVTITEPAALALTTSGTLSICAGGSTNLTASTTGGTGAYAYTWNPGAMTTSTVTLSPATTSSYTVDVVDANGCTTSQSVTVTVIQATTLLASGASQICSGQSATLTGNASNGGPYTWQPGNLTGSSVSVTPTTTTTYTVSVTDLCNNTIVTDTVTVSVETLVSQFSTAPISGCVPLTVQFTDQSSTSSGTVTGWFWEFGDGNTSTQQNPSHLYTTTGSFFVSLTVTNSDGCVTVFTSPIPVIVSPLPVAGFSITNLPVTSIEPEASFIDNSSGASTWQWDFGDGGTSSTQNPSHMYAADTGSYQITLIVTNAYGCSDTAYGDVIVYDDFTFYIPNAFTPNGNGLNENFSGYGGGIAEFHMFIFDRWGMLIYESTDINKPWDGTMKGNKAQEDVYVYKIQITDIFFAEHTYIGHVTLVR